MPTQALEPLFPRGCAVGRVTICAWVAAGYLRCHTLPVDPAPDTLRGESRAGSGSPHLLGAAGFRLLILGLLATMGVAVVIGIGAGAVDIAPGTTARVLAYEIFGLGDPPDPVDGQIIWELRAPRVFLALVVGAGLAVAGCALQAMVRNPLADPFIMGTAEGATVGAVLVIVLGSSAVGGLGISMAAFLGAMASMLLVFALARSRSGYAPGRLILTGVAIGYLMSALTGILQFIADPRELRGVLFWLLGSVAGTQWSDLGIPAFVVLTSVAWLALRSRYLNAYSLGEESAVALGVDIWRFRIELMLVTSVLVGAVVAVSGSIGFVGLMIPHAARMLVGPDHRRVLPLSLLLGAVFLCVVDILARVIAAPSELPLGIFTAAFGTPFFLWLLRTSLRRTEVG